jgi:hypothetical protein
MACQYKSTSCNMYNKKEDHRLAKKKFPNIDNPYEKWECTSAIEKTCKQFKPTPSQLTEDDYNKAKMELLQNVPIEFRSALAGLAYDLGSSNEEMLSILRNLVNALMTPITDYQERIAQKNP